MSEHATKIVYERKNLPGKLNMLGYLLLGVGLILAILAFNFDYARASVNSIIMFMFVMSIGLGSVFFIAVEYLVGAVWSVPFRRIVEFLGLLLFFAPIFAIPVFFDLHGVFHWSSAEAVAGDTLLKGKAPYLNTSFFIIRFVAIFLLVWFFYLVFARNSAKQDKTGDQKLTRINARFSAAFMPIFAITVTVLAIDWMMSLEPHWFSTIFGVYYFSGTFVAALAAITLISIMMNEKGYLVKGIINDHYYSLGALMFGFINFWAYIAFSQFLLIWYANLPEETFWFLTRFQGNWTYISVGLIFVHFVVPYILILPQPAKMDPKRLKLASAWILFAHFYDLYWLVMPSFSKKAILFGWMEIAFPILGVGLIIVVFSLAAKNRNHVPVGDPKFGRALDFRL